MTMLLAALLASAAAPALPPAQAMPARPPAIAARLAEAPLPDFGSRDAPKPLALGPALARAKGDRQAVRWTHAREMLARRRPDAALGALAVMAADEPLLRRVPAWRLTTAYAEVQLLRGDAAWALLDDPALAAAPVACALRVRAAALMPRRVDADELAIWLRCATPAVANWPRRDRRLYALAAARLGLTAGLPDAADRALASLPDRDAAANLLRARLAVLRGDTAAARLRLERVRLVGRADQQAQARIALLALTPAPGTRADLDALDAILFRQRGGAVERAALRLALARAEALGERARWLGYAAARLRHFPFDRDSSALQAELSRRLRTELAAAPDGLPAAADLLWRHRDLLPVGREGDAVVAALAERLELAGLWKRAAELAQYRMAQLPLDIDRGPLANQAALLWLRAGETDKADAVIMGTRALPLRGELAQRRDRLAAIVMARRGRIAEARTLISGDPGAADLRAAMAWHAEDWAGVVAETRGDDGRALIVLRRAVALAMLGNDAALDAMASRYAGRFAGRAEGRLLAMLADPDSAEPEALGAAIRTLDAGEPDELAALLLPPTKP